MHKLEIHFSYVREPCSWFSIYFPRISKGNKSFHPTVSDIRLVVLRDKERTPNRFCCFIFNFKGGNPIKYPLTLTVTGGSYRELFEGMRVETRFIGSCRASSKEGF